MRSAVAALGAAAVALAAAPAASAATAVEVRKACYAEGDSIGLDASGFTPGGNVRLSLERASGEELEATSEPVAEQDGTLGGTYRVDNETGWFTGQATRFDMTLRLVDQARLNAGQPESSADVTATTSFIFSRWNVGISTPGRRIHPKRRLRFKAFGFTNAVGKRLYAHWVRGSRRVHTKRFRVLRAPCGDTAGRLSRGFPFRPVPRGRYRVMFNSSRTNPFARGSITHRTVRVKRRLR